MIVGMFTILIWYNSSLSQWLYELVPGFAFSIIALVVVSFITGGSDKETAVSFTKYLESIRGVDDDRS
ncbi:MAG: hypothetical protein QME46_01825 [Thermoanaerobacteraceae bacterium]|nr:hypothetical protein [Thermoanaerobacteraceae bacterium]